MSCRYYTYILIYNPTNEKQKCLIGRFQLSCSTFSLSLLANSRPCRSIYSELLVTAAIERPQLQQHYGRGGTVVRTDVHTRRTCLKHRDRRFAHDTWSRRPVGTWHDAGQSRLIYYVCTYFCAYSEWGVDGIIPCVYIIMCLYNICPYVGL